LASFDASVSGRLKAGRYDLILAQIHGDVITMTSDSDRRPEFHVNLKVNDSEIELNDFVQSFLARTVMGMLESLRGVSDVQSASLTLRKPAGKSLKQE
jgi:hypothetical protein